MSKMTLKNVSKRYDDKNYAVRDVSLEIEAIENLGGEHILHFQVDGQKMCARIEGECQAERHEIVEIFLNLDRMKLFDPDTEKNLFYGDRGGIKVCSKST